MFCFTFDGFFRRLSFEFSKWLFRTKEAIWRKRSNVPLRPPPVICFDRKKVSPKMLQRQKELEARQFILKAQCEHFWRNLECFWRLFSVWCKILKLIWRNFYGIWGIFIVENGPIFRIQSSHLVIRYRPNTRSSRMGIFKNGREGLWYSNRLVHTYILYLFMLKCVD